MLVPPGWNEDEDGEVRILHAAGGAFASDPIGTLSRWVSPRSGSMDAAIAETTREQVGACTNDRNPVAPRPIPADDAGNLPVKKHGYATETTHGRVLCTNATVFVSYEGLGAVRFEDQIIVVPRNGRRFAALGDSGSLVMTDTSENRPVGLLFAVGGLIRVQNQERVLNACVVSPIGKVLDALDVEIDPVTDCSPQP